MANEAVLIFETGLPIPFTVADGTGIEKGAICKLTDPLTAAIADGTGDDVAGIAASEKIADDGKVKLGMYREGIFKVYASGSITAGDAVSTCTGEDPNHVIVAVAAAVGGSTLGIALETASTGETFLMELKPGCNNQAYS